MDDYDDDDYDDRYDEPTPPPTPPPHQHDESLLSDLTALFREALNDFSIPTSTVDAVVTATNYDVDAAIEQLRRERAVQPAQLAKPSAIGQMFASASSDAAARTPEPDLCERFQQVASIEGRPGIRGERRGGGHMPSLSEHDLAAQFQQIVSLEGGPAVRMRDGGEKPFQFDRPSPDDMVTSTRGKASTRAATLRLPKASTRKNVRITVKKQGETKDSAKEVKKAVEKKPRKEERKEPQIVKQRAKTVDVALRGAHPASVAIVVAGHVDAGKSTLLNHFLELLDGRRRREVLAWGTDEDPVERERGVTIDIATRIFERNGRSYAMIDAPGHRDFVPAMILGAAQASAGLLVVDASPGEFEAGFKPEGQTREHVLVLRSLGVGYMIVVVNKMDRAEWDQRRYNEVCEKLTEFFKNNGWKVRTNVKFLPVSGRDGTNLVKGPGVDHPLTHWYTGKTLLQELEATPSATDEAIAADSAKPTRLIVSDFFRSTSLGGAGAVTGRLVCGTIAPKDKLRICPGDAIATVKNVEIDMKRVKVAVAGADSLPVSLGLQDLTEGLLVTPGNVLCDPEAPVQAAAKFSAQVIVTGANALLVPGTMGELHVGGGAEAASVTRLCKYVGAKRSGKTPRRLVKGDSAIVEIGCERGVAMERSKDVKGLGRFALRQEGVTVAVGIVLEILESRAPTGTEDSG